MLLFRFSYVAVYMCCSFANILPSSWFRLAQLTANINVLLEFTPLFCSHIATQWNSATVIYQYRDMYCDMQ